MTPKKNTEKYTAEQIKVLEGLEAVRKRPGMYIGSTCSKGLHHLVYEVIANSIDEAMAGHGNYIETIIHKDNSITVIDNGRGIPVDMHETGRPAVEVVLTVLHAGGKFGDGGYKVSGGLHGVGVSVVNALCERMDVEVKRDKKIHKISFSKGNVTKELEVVKELKIEETGTKINFLPDKEIFETDHYDYKTLKNRFRELAFLNKNITIKLTDEREDKTEEFHFEGGIKTYVEEINKTNEDVINKEVIYITGEKERIIGTNDVVEVAFQYNKKYNENVYSYVNNISTIDGGTHLTGFKQALNKSLNYYAKKLGFNKDKEEEKSSMLKWEDVREGLVAIVSVKFVEPQFEGQTKGKLNSTEARGLVDGIVYNYLMRYFEENQDVCKDILDKIYLSKKAREMAQKTLELQRSKNDLNKSSSFLSGKLAHCSSKQPEECEIYLVEGDSAGGSAKQGRDRRTQAILPLRGKILNVEKARLDKILNNEEIRTMITAFAHGIGDDCDISKSRYHKIIIMTDADVDGQHIRTLLLTFFYRYMKKAIEAGMIYAARPPLFLIKSGKEEKYAYTEKELDEVVASFAGKKYTIQRYKGLGEMNPEQLWETTMNPNTRSLYRINIDDAIEADHTFSLLMGEDVPPRRGFIEENAHKVFNLDF